jgi:hypothetical protein
MESTVATSQAPSAPPSPPLVEGGPSALELAALRQPALVRAGSGWLSVGPRLWLGWIIQAAQDAMEITLDRPVTIELLAADPGSPREGVFTIDFEHPGITGGGGGGGIIALDLPAARAVVDALESDFANVRGAGALSDAELGVLEYATLAILDRVLRASGAPPAARSFVLRGFGGSGSGSGSVSVSGQAAASASSAVALAIRIAGREGIVRLHVQGWAGEAIGGPPPSPAAQTAAASVDGATTTIDLRLALPPVRLDRKEALTLQAGDVILLGATDLHAFAANCRLATSGGWSLSSASIVRDSAAVLTARCGPFSLRTLAAASPDEPQAILNILVGFKPIAIEGVRQWQADGTIDLPKDPALAADVYDGLKRIGRGELVRLEGEIGVRLIETGGAPAPEVRRS